MTKDSAIYKIGIENCATYRFTILPRFLALFLKTIPRYQMLKISNKILNLTETQCNQKGRFEGCDPKFSRMVPIYGPKISKWYHNIG